MIIVVRAYSLLQIEGWKPAPQFKLPYYCIICHWQEGVTRSF